MGTSCSLKIKNFGHSLFLNGAGAEVMGSLGNFQRLDLSVKSN